MEELLSTDNIHREILDDAKRKAAKILKNAENAIASADSEWDAKLQKAVDEMKARYEAEIAGRKSEAKARMAIDKTRAKLSKVTGELEKALGNFFRMFERKDALAVLERALSARLASVKAASVTHDGSLKALDFSGLEVETHGLTKAEAETILGHLSLTAAHIDVRKAGGGERSAANETLSANKQNETNEFLSIILWTGDIKMTASLRTEAEAMLLSKRAEVAEALFG
jgi:hypothetical protein